MRLLERLCGLFGQKSEEAQTLQNKIDTSKPNSLIGKSLDYIYDSLRGSIRETWSYNKKYDIMVPHILSEDIPSGLIVRDQNGFEYVTGRTEHNYVEDISGIFLHPLHGGESIQVVLPLRPDEYIVSKISEYYERRFS